MIYADRVKETTTTTGTGTYDLAGAATGFQGVVAAIGDAAVGTFCVTDNTDWEVFIGTVTDAATDTLARTRILASSNAGAAVNWGSGSKDVMLVEDGTTVGARKSYLDPWPSVSSEALFTEEGTGLTIGDFTFVWRNQGSSTFESKYGVGSLAIPTSSSNNLRGLEVTETASTYVYEMSARGLVRGINKAYVGMWLADSTNGKLVTHSVAFDGDFTIRTERWNSVTSFDTNLQWKDIRVQLVDLILRVQKNTATSWDFALSPDGVSWWTVLAGTNLTTFLTPDRIGFFANAANNGPCFLTVNSFRKVS